MQIGSYHLANKLILAPMAGISDRPFRELCTRFGACMTVSEMVAANPALRKHRRTVLKSASDDGRALHAVQILGTNPRQMADAAAFNVHQGARIIDINMGCPAKKVCSVAAGSALLKDEALVGQILEAVVNAVDVPVTLKIRTGWDRHNRNAIRIAKIAENAGIAALTVHGRTRACKFEGRAEHETVALVKQAVKLPVIANGDIDSPQTAKQVLDATGADAVMIGRAARGNPWLFAQTAHYLSTGQLPMRPTPAMIRTTAMEHLEKLYSFYGDVAGVRIARKHIGWYLTQLNAVPPHIRKAINEAVQPSEQAQRVLAIFDYQ